MSATTDNCQSSNNLIYLLTNVIKYKEKITMGWFKKHKVMSVILGLIVLGVIGSAMGGGNSGNTSSSGSNSSTKQPEKTEFAVAETATIGDQSVTVSKITRDYQTGNQFAKAETGKEFVVVEVLLQNNGKSQIDFNTFDFQMQDSNGVLKGEDFTALSENKLNSGNLAAGGKVTGNLAFQVPKGDAGLKLVFKPSFWSNKTITFKL